jgi:hypothetical protein
MAFLVKFYQFCWIGTSRRVVKLFRILKVLTHQTNFKVLQFSLSVLFIGIDCAILFWLGAKFNLFVNHYSHI